MLIVRKLSEVADSMKAPNRMKKKDVPQIAALMNPTPQALKQLGGSASIDELALMRRGGCKQGWDGNTAS